MLYFQGLYGFRRDSPAFLNDCKAIENTGQTGFFGISDDSSQIVVTVISLPEQHFRKNIKTRCLQNYKQRIFICRSIIKIVSNHKVTYFLQIMRDSLSRTFCWFSSTHWLDVLNFLSALTLSNSQPWVVAISANIKSTGISTPE